MPCVTHTPPLFELPGDVCEQDAGRRDVGTACSRGLAVPSDSGQGAQPWGPAVTQAFVTPGERGSSRRSSPSSLPLPQAAPCTPSPGRLLPAWGHRDELPVAGALRQGLVQPFVPVVLAPHLCPLWCPLHLWEAAGALHIPAATTVLWSVTLLAPEGPEQL